jgi:hypothetical protein
LEVVDNASSTPLFFIEGVRPYAHLEFAKGFAVFDNGRGESGEAHQYLIVIASY